MDKSGISLVAAGTPGGVFGVVKSAALSAIEGPPLVVAAAVTQPTIPARIQIPLIFPRFPGTFWFVDHATASMGVWRYS